MEQPDNTVELPAKNQDELDDAVMHLRGFAALTDLAFCAENALGKGARADVAALLDSLVDNLDRTVRGLRGN
jgi:hypothetical protein